MSHTHKKSKKRGYFISNTILEIPYEKRDTTLDTWQRLIGLIREEIISACVISFELASYVVYNLLFDNNKSTKNWVIFNDKDSQVLVLYVFLHFLPISSITLLLSFLN